MIVEIFIRGTNPSFLQYVDTYWNILSISVDNDNFILKTEESEPNIVLSTIDSINYNDYVYYYNYLLQHI